MSRRISQMAMSPQPPQAAMTPVSPAGPQPHNGGGCILPGYDKELEQRAPRKHHMKSNIFGIDENTKFDGSRSGIFSGGDEDLKLYQTGVDPNQGKPYFDQRARERLLLENVTLANGDDIRQGLQIIIENGLIKEISAKPIAVPDETPRLDACDHYCMPGFIDFNTHLQWQSHDPTLGVLKTLSQHAVLGGTTTIVETLVCPPAICPFELVDRFNTAITMSGSPFWCDVVIRVSLIELTQAIIDEKMPPLVQELGVHSFVFHFQLDEAAVALLELALAKCAELGCVALVRCDGQPLTNAYAGKSPEEIAKIELIACEAVAQICLKTDCPVVMLSLESQAALDFVQRVHSGVPNLPMQATISMKALPGQETATMTWLMGNLARGNLIGVTSDQTTLASPDGYALAQRSGKFWHTAMSSGASDLPSFCDMTSTLAAKFLGLYPSKGRVQVGADADLVLWPVGESSQPSVVIVAGEVVARAGQLAIEKPGGMLYATPSRPNIPFEMTRNLRHFKEHWPDFKANFAMSQDELSRMLANHSLLGDAKKADEATAGQQPAGQQQQRAAGGRKNLFESSFTFGGTEAEAPMRTSVKTNFPPGGGGDTKLW